MTPWVSRLADFDLDLEVVAATEERTDYLRLLMLGVKEYVFGSTSI